MVVPVVTLQASPFTSVAPTSGSVALTPPSAPVFTSQPRVTLVAHDGIAVLGFVAIPMLVSIVVGLLLWHSVRRHSSLAGRLASRVPRSATPERLAADGSTCQAPTIAEFTADELSNAAVGAPLA
jgi:hypothetical protein